MLRLKIKFYLSRTRLQSDTCIAVNKINIDAEIKLIGDIFIFRRVEKPKQASTRTFSAIVVVF